MKHLALTTKRAIFREPYLPPPVSPLSILFMMVVVGGGLAVTVLSVVNFDTDSARQSLSGLTLGLGLTSIGTAESLSSNRAGVAGTLRLVSLLLILVTFWLIGTSV